MKIKNFITNLNDMDKFTTCNTKSILVDLLDDNDTETINDYLTAHGSNYTAEDVKKAIEILQFLLEDDPDIDVTWPGR